MGKKDTVDIWMFVAITIALILYLIGEVYLAIAFFIIGFAIGWFRGLIYKLLR